MKKTLMTLAAAAVLAVGFASGANAAAATIINDFGCILIAADGPYGFTVSTTDSHAVVTNNIRGNSVLKCKFKAPPNPLGRAFNNRGFPCGTFAGGTTKSHVTVSRTGNVTLTCRTP